MPLMTEHSVFFGGPRHGQVIRQPDLPELVIWEDGDTARYYRTNMIFLAYQVWVIDYQWPILRSGIDLEEFEEAIMQQRHKQITINERKHNAKRTE